MNDQAGYAQLLAGSRVALAAVVWKNVHLAKAESRILWADPSFRTRRAHGAEKVSLNRVLPAKGKALEQGRLRYRLRRALRRGALQGYGGASLGNERAGARGHLLSKGKACSARVKD